MHDIYMTTQLISHVLHGLVQRQSGLADHEEIDVAGRIVASGHVRAEEESESDAGILFECLCQPQWHAARPSEEVPQGRVKGMLAVDPPEAKTAQPTAAQYTARFEPLESALCGVRVRFGPANDLVRVQLLPWSRREERQDPCRGLASDQWMPGTHHALIVYDHIPFDNAQAVSDVWVRGVSVGQSLTPGGRALRKVPRLLDLLIQCRQELAEFAALLGQESPRAKAGPAAGSVSRVRASFSAAGRTKTSHPDRQGDALQRQFSRLRAAGHAGLEVGGLGDKYLARRGERCQPRRDIHVLSECCEDAELASPAEIAHERCSRIDTGTDRDPRLLAFDVPCRA